MATIPFLGVPQQQARRLIPTSMSDSPFWGDSPELWDDITLAGLSGFGIIELSIKKGQRIDDPQAPGADAPEMTHMGFFPAEITIKIRMWTQEHWDNWRAIAKYFQWLNRPPDGEPERPVRTQGPIEDPSGGTTTAGASVNGVPTREFVPGVVDRNPPQLGTLAAPRESVFAPRQGPDPVTVDHPSLAAHGIKYVFIAAVEPPKPTGTSGVFEATIQASEWRPRAKKKVTGIHPVKEASTPVEKRNTVYGDLIKNIPPSKGLVNP